MSDVTTPSALEVSKFHTNADVDSKRTGMHHTLGPRNFQAAPGDHTHNGGDSVQLMSDIVITGAKGGNAALADLITKLAAALGFSDATT